MEQEKPLLAITSGDPAGVGPEVIAAAWTSPELHQTARAFVLGHPEVLRRAVALRGVQAEVVEIASPQEADSSPARLPCLACGSDNAAALVVQARGHSSEVEVFGPMLAEPVGSRVSADIGRWKSGDQSCGAAA